MLLELQHILAVVFYRFETHRQHGQALPDGNTSQAKIHLSAMLV